MKSAMMGQPTPRLLRLDSSRGRRPQAKKSIGGIEDVLWWSGGWRTKSAMKENPREAERAAQGKLSDGRNKSDLNHRGTEDTEI